MLPFPLPELPSFDPVLFLFVFGLTQMVKKAELLPSRFLPLCATIIGALSNAYITQSFTDPNVVVMGALVGLVTAGVFDAVKSGVEKLQGEE